MSDLERLLAASVTIKKQKKLIEQQTRQIQLLQARLRIVDLRQAKRLRESELLPSLLRPQAGG